jgi:hypothetical protein
MLSHSSPPSGSERFQNLDELKGGESRPSGPDEPSGFKKGREFSAFMFAVLLIPTLPIAVVGIIRRTVVTLSIVEIGISVGTAVSCTCCIFTIPAFTTVALPVIIMGIIGIETWCGVTLPVVAIVIRITGV